MYHYTGGVIWGVLKRWDEAEEFFESVVCAPGQGVVGSALQLEALKKWVLVQLISKGKVCLFYFFSFNLGCFFFRSLTCVYVDDAPTEIYKLPFVTPIQTNALSQFCKRLSPPTCQPRRSHEKRNGIIQ